MHITFAAARRADAAASGAKNAGSSPDSALMLVVRDPDDESEWQYLGNPEIATTLSLQDVVTRFIKDCSGPDGTIDAGSRAAVRQVRDALLSAAQLIDDVLTPPGKK